ncbi:MAG TPA: cysteine desulfurase family protein [bacterium]|nr:cysteine desulfurase family protein [bacterium]
MRTIFCDHNSTTRTDPRVAAAMQEVAVEHFANPSSSHRMGQAARVRLDEARARIAALLGAKPSEIVFTASGSEADNLAILGSLLSTEARGKHFVTVASEHPAITATAGWAQAHGFETTIVPVDSLGRIDPAEFARTLRPDTQIASVMLANNEVGTVHPIADLAQIARARGVVFHTDAVQAYGKIPVNVNELGVDLLSLSSHKFYGPKGVGILYVRQGTRLAPILFGGGQEQGRRPGTENVPGAVGTALAMQIAAEEPQEIRRVGKLADEFRKLISQKIEDIMIFGDPERRLPNTVAVGFGGVEGESLAIALDLRGICVSTGSACHSGAHEPSHVLRAMAAPRHYALGAIRFSFGRDSKPDDPALIAAAAAEEVARLRALSPAHA